MKRAPLALVLVIVGAAGAGLSWAGSAPVPYEESLNPGLVRASDSVLRNLLGDSAAGVSMSEGDGSTPPTLFIDLSDQSRIRIRVREFEGAFPPDPCYPPDPCVPAYELEVGANGGDPACSVGYPPDPCHGASGE